MNESRPAGAVPEAERPSRDRSVWAVLGVAFVMRLSVVLWAAPRFPPAFDGSFYHVVASRIAQGHGYTWLWPDGAVTYAAHYPVGYPALIGGAYALFGAEAWVAMLVNLAIGCAAVLAAYCAAASLAGRRVALVASLAVALHPTFVFYTPALMTEAVSAALLVIAAWPAVRARFSAEARTRLSWAVAAGLVLGVVALVRPQLVLVAPLYGWIAASSARARAELPVAGERASRRVRIGSGALLAVVAVAACLPWTLRNCYRMDRCVFVSANAGWNLLIGAAPEARGSWLPLEQVGVPPACREVFEEASKDVCFRAAALERIGAEPVAWLALAPQKLRATFDFPMAAAHYLEASNPASFPASASRALMALESVAHRLLVLGLAAATLLAPGPRRRWRQLLGALACALSLSPWGTLALLVAVLNGLLVGYRQLAARPLLPLALGAVAATALVHVAFFGAARYGLVTSGLLALAAAHAFEPRRRSTRRHV